MEELISRIKNLLAQFGNGAFGTNNSKSNSAIVEYGFGDAKINFQTYEVTVAGKPIRLTQLQIKVLKYFIEHESVVIPRAQLLEDVWEMPGHMNTRAPDQIMRQLRKTFEANPSKPVHFLTIRDAGYRFLRDPDSNSLQSNDS